VSARLIAAAIVLVVGLSGCGGSDGSEERAARFDPSCQLLCAVRGGRDGVQSGIVGIEGAQRYGAAERPWGLWDERGPDGIHVLGSADVDQVWISGPSVPGGNDLHRVDVMERNFEPPAAGGLALTGQLIYTRQRYTGRWADCCSSFQALGSPRRGPGNPIPVPIAREPRFFTSVSVAGVREQLHVCALSNGRIWHISRRNNPSVQADLSGFDDWGFWTDVESQAGGNRGPFVDVSCASVRNPTTGSDDLHVCALSRSTTGRLWHTIGTGPLTANGFSTWTPLVNVGQAAGLPWALHVDCAGNRGQLHLAVATGPGAAWAHDPQPERGMGCADRHSRRGGLPDFHWLLVRRDRLLQCVCPHRRPERLFAAQRRSDQ
jgi:hypothetical protein